MSESLRAGHSPASILAESFASLDTPPEIEIYTPASSNIIAPQLSSSQCWLQLFPGDSEREATTGVTPHSTSLLNSQAIKQQE
jgi:hypothetical protein